MQQAKQNHLGWIDGIKGIACIIIFVHHFLLMFMPGAFYGSRISGAGRISRLLAESPLGVLVNGNFCVCLFMMLSGAVLSYKILQSDNDIHVISEVVSTRYLRLTLPVVAVSAVVFLLMQVPGAFQGNQIAAVTGSPWAAGKYTQVPSIKGFFIITLFKTWLQGSDVFSTAFWMLTYSFYGSFLCVICSLAAIGRDRRKIIVLFFLISFAFFHVENGMIYLACFPLGNIIGMMVHSGKQREGQKEEGRMRAVKTGCRVLCLIAGLYLGGYPSGTETGAAAGYGYQYLKLQPYYAPQYVVAHITGAFLLLAGASGLAGVQKALGNKVFRGLGKISYAAYLVHIPILFTVSTRVYMYCIGRCGRAGSIGICFAVTAVLVAGCAYGFYTGIERPAGRLVKKVDGWFRGK